MSEETEEPTAEQLEAAQRVYLSEIMRQLTTSDRFNRFFEANYEVQTYFDKEQETYDVRLIERPPELAARRLEDMLVEHAKEHMPAIAVPTEAELTALQKDFKTK